MTEADQISESQLNTKDFLLGFVPGTIDHVALVDVLELAGRKVNKLNWESCKDRIERRKKVNPYDVSCQKVYGRFGIAEADDLISDTKGVEEMIEEARNLNLFPPKGVSSSQKWLRELS
jgi:hypothetical protein